MADLLTEIEAARERLAPDLPPTPLISGTGLRRQLGPLHLKLEVLQPTGSFKVRPALNGVLTHLGEARARGVVAASSGNYAQALAWAASRCGVKASIVMMEGASSFKRERTRSWGAEIIPCENRFAARQETTDRIVRESGAIPLHPYDSVETIAGDGVIGLELLEQLNKPFCVIVPVSGGGLVSGIAAAVKERRPACRVIGVQAAANPSMRISLHAGERLTSQPGPTLADSLMVATPGERTLPLAQRYVDDVVLVSEDEIADAVRLLAVEQKLAAEGGGAVAVAALAAGKIDTQGLPPVCVISGGNILPAKLAELLAA